VRRRSRRGTAESHPAILNVVLDTRELDKLRWDVESDRVERKSSANDSEKLRQAICAFANDLPDHRKPGVLFVGLQDDGRCANVRVDDDLLKLLASMRHDGNIHPFPMMSVQQVVFEDGCTAAVVQVEPSDRPPVRFDGRTWIRVGPRRAIATEDEERRLTEKRRAGSLPFDVWPVPGASLADLDLDLFRRSYLPAAIAPEVLAANHRTTDWQLASLRLVTPGAFQPTVLGVLVLGKDPRAWFPGAYVQFVRFEGTTLTDPVKTQQEVSGPLTEVLRGLDQILGANVSIATDVASQATEVRRPDYPVAALQQLLRNAVMHRTYEATNAPIHFYWFSDRIEIQSPGGPFGVVRVDTFGEPGATDYRNPHVAEAMKILGYVQRFGIGIQLARAELNKNANPALQFTVDPSHVLATVRRRP
jgi:ATP-dependent DNA helicase RecG